MWPKQGCTWRGLPKQFGRWHTIYMRMNRWAKNGVLNRVFDNCNWMLGAEENHSSLPGFDVNGKSRFRCRGKRRRRRLETQARGDTCPFQLETSRGSAYRRVQRQFTYYNIASILF